MTCDSINFSPLILQSSIVVIKVVRTMLHWTKIFWIVPHFDKSGQLTITHVYGLYKIGTEHKVAITDNT